MRSLKTRGFVLLFGASFLIGCGDGSTASGPPSKESVSSIEVPKTDTNPGKGKAGLKKRAATGQTPAVPD
jgi:hypothetical protein